MTSDGAIPAGTVDMNLEVVTLPVSDPDRAKDFYQNLGWRLDADIVRGDAFRVIQFTPPHSGCSVAFGRGVTTGEPGSLRRLILAVSDIEAARSELAGRGVEVSGLFHLAGGRAPGPDPEGRSYQTYAAFSDPDGNEWLLQEITTGGHRAGPSPRTDSRCRIWWPPPPGQRTRRPSSARRCLGYPADGWGISTTRQPSGSSIVTAPFSVQ
jgi:catechol 2,3-dioxygenase-like lactoylglutathione lyase family enzyme